MSEMNTAPAPESAPALDVEGGDSPSTPNQEVEMSPFDQAVALLDEANKEPTNEVVVEESTEENKEPAKEEEVPAEKPESLSKAWVKLQAKEKELSQQASELRQYQEQIASYQEAMKVAQNDPLQFLEKAGISLEALTEHLLNGPKQIDPMQQKIQELEQFKQQVEQERQMMNQQKMVNDYKNELNTYLSSNSEQYPLISRQDSTDVVWDVIIESARQGQVLSPKEASDMVEGYYNSLKDQFVTPTQENNTGIKQAEVKETPKPVRDQTLSNQVESAVPLLDRNATEQERLEMAIKYLDSIKT